ncbi:hypothetical protein P3342_005126 [Pyrenophora teres f. teres]|nr:hypothetical protein P3342_005126 [Pyrenophora teres f. teres]
MPVSSPTHPFASPNAIPPRTSSTGITSLNGNSIRHPSTSSVLRPLSETDWIAQSKKSKTSHSAEPLNPHLRDQTSQSHMSDRHQAMTSDTGYSTPITAVRRPKGRRRRSDIRQWRCLDRKQGAHTAGTIRLSVRTPRKRHTESVHCCIQSVAKGAAGKT